MCSPSPGLSSRCCWRRWCRWGCTWDKGLPGEGMWHHAHSRQGELRTVAAPEAETSNTVLADSKGCSPCSSALGPCAKHALAPRRTLPAFAHACSPRSMGKGTHQYTLVLVPLTRRA